MFARFYSRLGPVMLGTFLIAGVGSAQTSDQVRLSSGDYTCLEDERLASEQFARDHRDRICNEMDDWGVARLAGGGSISGPGNDCAIREIDNRPAPQSVCVPLENTSFIRGILLFSDLRTPRELLASTPGEWREILVQELSNRTGEEADYYSTLDIDELAALAGLVFYLQRAERNDPLALASLSAREIRQAVRIDVNEQTGMALNDLVRLSDLELFSILIRG